MFPTSVVNYRFFVGKFFQILNNIINLWLYRCVVHAIMIWKRTPNYKKIAKEVVIDKDVN
jgi:hypothetical protein